MSVCVWEGRVGHRDYNLGMDMESGPDLSLMNPDSVPPIFRFLSLQSCYWLLTEFSASPIGIGHYFNAQPLSLTQINSQPNSIPKHLDDGIIESSYWHLKATVVLVHAWKEGAEERGIQLVVICIITTRCHQILHTAPLRHV